MLEGSLTRRIRCLLPALGGHRKARYEFPGDGILIGQGHSVNVAFAIVGAALVLTVIRDIFHTLFNPSKQGDLSEWIARSIWRTFRRVLPRALNYAGPVAFISIVGYWTASVILGFALIYLPYLPNSFTVSEGIPQAPYVSFAGALVTSIGGLITLSTGLYATHPWIELLMGIESIMGFGLLTASVSWILSIYPVLEHRKSLAHEASLVHFSESTGIRRLADVSESDVHSILLGLASQLSSSRIELMQFPITYYFHEQERQTSLAAILPYLADIAAQNVNRKGGAALAATALGGAVDDYLKFIARTFLRRPFTDRHEILQAFAADHLRDVVRSPVVVRKAALTITKLQGGRMDSAVILYRIAIHVRVGKAAKADILSGTWCIFLHKGLGETWDVGDEVSAFDREAFASLDARADGTGDELGTRFRFPQNPGRGLTPGRHGRLPQFGGVAAAEAGKRHCGAV